MPRKARSALLATALILAALAAAPPLVGAITATLFTTSRLSDEVNVNNDRIRLKTKDPTDVADWHNHPAFALIAVNSGTMTFLDPDCTAHTVGPGQAFVESGGPTKAVNQGNVEALFYVTYLLPEGSP